MASTLQLLFFTLSCLFLHGTANQTPKPYVVYMGSSNDRSHRTNAVREFEASQLQMLSTVILSGESERLSIIHGYNHAFMGFSAMLTDKEASVLSGHAGVVSVFPDPILQLHTTHSWDFLEKEARPRHGQRYPHFTRDVIVGMIDTGIWPESLSFNDAGMGPIPSRWKGTCMEGSDFKRSNCNRKLIGARYYHSMIDSAQPQSTNASVQAIRAIGSARDTVGHGTHTASIAVGSMVRHANYYGLAQGTARGGLPSSRVAMYKVCTLAGCSGSAILKAIDDAIKDGVDIISISVGIVNAMFQSDFVNDPIAIGAFHANQKGVMVVCSGGNDGPDPFTVVNSAPWVFTVAASSIDREFQSTIVLGNGVAMKGSGINFSNLTRTKLYPLAAGRDVAGQSVPFLEASNCYPGSLDARKAAGKIIVCVDNESTVSRRVKRLVAENARAKGLILIDEVEKGVPYDSSDFPFSNVGSMVGAHILRYINSTKNPTATILPTVAVTGTKPAPTVAYFSSRGPGSLTQTILKPDATAPGVGILASTIPAIETGEVPFGKKPSNFAIKSGTSMACPHVTGAAAYLKSAHPTWTPSMIKSALMTTATPLNNMGEPVTNSSNNYASPHEMGAGEINPLRALYPGLVYDTTTNDYLNFLCYYGYKEHIIGNISGSNFNCPKTSSENLISNLNYPSISITNLASRRSAVTIARTVTNVGPTDSVYVAMIDTPVDLAVKVSPVRLVFSKHSARASFSVTFRSNGAKKGYHFGSITWSDSTHFVRTVFAVNIV
eukprot:TRINITY_DN5896_c2_g1_i1.p1 TRINITY_DN5896_c2_g1~~TRINITY_DN5896_c2_g1_i1.p1  ORF type:complete len:776 (-),score=95.66 TRINITY_DN5896_c2_g1_i1:137-2464(-)